MVESPRGSQIREKGGSVHVSFPLTILPFNVPPSLPSHAGGGGHFFHLLAVRLGAVLGALRKDEPKMGPSAFSNILRLRKNSQLFLVLVINLVRLKLGTSFERV